MIKKSVQITFSKCHGTIQFIRCPLFKNDIYHISPVLLWLMSGLKDDVMKRNHYFGRVRFPHDLSAI